MEKIYDITIEMHSNMPAFPGDESVFEMSDIMKVQDGDLYSIKKLKMLTHTGTHIDAPSHFIPDGKNMDELSLSKFIGLAEVIEIENDEKVSKNEIYKYDINPDIIVLFKTQNSKKWKTTNDFYKNFIYIAPDAAEYLVEKKIKTVGIDYLSADKYSDNNNTAHHILLKNDIPIIEGLDLSKVSPGRYQLICLPLKIKGIDGSPARAVLIKTLFD